MVKKEAISFLLASVCLFIAATVLADEFPDTTGDLTLTRNTVVNGAKVIRGGSLTIGAGVTLQVNPNSSLIFEKGYQITNRKGGAVILVSRNNAYIAKVPPIPCVNISCYRDNDGDGYGTGIASTYCNSCPAGYASQAGDCCDSDATSYPGYPAYGITPNRCGSWDRDCNGVIWKSYWNCPSCTRCQGIINKSPALYERCDCTAVVSVECGQPRYACSGQATCLGCGSPPDGITGWGGCAEVGTCFPTSGYACLGLPCYRGTTCNRTVIDTCGCK